MEPTPKRKRLSLSRKKKVDTMSATRFKFTTSPKVDEMKRKVIPKNTDKCTQWALKVFNDWTESRKEAGEKVPPEDILCTDDEQILRNWLCRFFTEVRKGDGSYYCPRSLSSMLASLQRHIENVSPHGARIQNREGHFKPLHTLLENLYKNLHKQGVGTSTVQSEIVTHDEEKTLWECGALGVHSPESLLNAVFYYNGLNFTLRGGDEHRNLSLTQITFGNEPDPADPTKVIKFVEYTENGSKNRPGGCKQLNLYNKNVRHYEQPLLGDRCHVHHLQ